MKNLLGALVLSSVVALSGCSTLMGSSKSSNSAVLASSPVLPAAQGNVNFAQEKNGNVKVDLHVKHLADPAHLTPPATSYVVWIQRGNNAAPENIGDLKVDKDLNGSLQTVTPQHAFDLFVTAETNGQTDKPNGQRLLWTSYKG